jgi:hypothetical protein
MREVKVAPIMVFFSKLEDPRSDINKLHPLETVEQVQLPFMCAVNRTKSKVMLNKFNFYLRCAPKPEVSWRTKFKVT